MEGTPAESSGEKAGAVESDSSQQEGELEDAPPGNMAHYAVKFYPDSGGGRSQFVYKGPSVKIQFQITLKLCAYDPELCKQVARLCYVKFEEGATQDEVIKYRGSLYQRIRDEGCLRRRISSSAVAPTDLPEKQQENKPSGGNEATAKDELKVGPVSPKGKKKITEEEAAMMQDEAPPSHLLDLLPEDVPADSESHACIKLQRVVSNGTWYESYTWKFQGDVGRVTVVKAGKCREAAAKLARLCYAKLESGASKEEVSQFRTQMYKKLQEGASSLASSDIDGAGKEESTSRTNADGAGKEESTSRTNAGSNGASAGTSTKPGGSSDVVVPKGVSWEELLPEDVPPEHKAHQKVRYETDITGGGLMKFKAGGVSFQVTVKKCRGNIEAALRIGRLCFAKLEEGVSKEETTEFRNSLYKLMGSSIADEAEISQENGECRNKDKKKFEAKRTDDEDPIAEAPPVKSRRLDASTTSLIEPSHAASAGKALDAEITTATREPSHAASAGERAPSVDWQLLLPDDLPAEHPSHQRVSFVPASGNLQAVYKIKGSELTISLHATKNNQEMAARVARLCCAKHLEGETAEDVTAYRNSLYRKIFFAYWKVSEDAEKEAPSKDDIVEWQKLLPDDAPDESAAYQKVKYLVDKDSYFFKTAAGFTQTNPVGGALGIRGAAARISRLCYLKIEDGATKKEGMEYRSSLIQKLVDATDGSFVPLVRRGGRRKRDENVDADGPDAKKAKKEQKEKKEKKDRKEKKEKKAKKEKKEQEKEEMEQDKEEAEPEEKEEGDEKENAKSSSSSSSESEPEDASAKPAGSSSSSAGGSESKSSDSDASNLDVAPVAPKLQLRPRMAVAKMSVRSGLRCYCHYKLICPSKNGSAQTH